MKKIIALIVVILSFSCQKSNENSFKITATVEDVADNTLVELKELVENRPFTIDSTYVKNNTFQFTGVADTPEMHFISIKEVSGNLPFILENGNIKIKVNTDNLNDSDITGTKENELFGSYTDLLMNASKSNKILNAQYKAAQEKKDTSMMAEVRKRYDSLSKAKDDLEIKFIKDNNNTLMAALVIERLLHNRSNNIKELKTLYDALPDFAKESRSGKYIDRTLTPMLATAEGAVAPQFEAPNPDGDLIALKDITSNNKVTIVDFWAAWCGPCRKENPNLVKLYSKYKDKGLEIVGVSLDGTTRQKDPKAAWVKAINDDGLTWQQVSNLKYFQGPIAQSYNIRSIPATFLLDNEGKIIGKGLRGSALEHKISEILD